ncbi:hypothetical protein [Natronoglomus mannanivorans]|uniref:Uncharacterized protein n=1 Tax=Natronoglomus mannanivorans TaxID=2979990 RepID=A0AAP2Z2V4_9EURY|nr:hypothetical protein [Halobacteria archaeon AArc-xg1-1]
MTITEPLEATLPEPGRQQKAVIRMLVPNNHVLIPESRTMTVVSNS